MARSVNSGGHSSIIESRSEASTSVGREIKSSDRQNLAITWFFAVFLNAFAIPIAIVLPPKIKAGDDKVLYLFLLFPVLGVLLLYRAIRATIQYRKFGTSVLTMLSASGAIGGSLSGIIRTGIRIHSAKIFRLTLRCIQRVTTGSGKNRRTEEKVLWEDWRDVREMSGDTDQSGIPVLFEIPSTCSATNSTQSISWKLEAKADIPGVDFETCFEVPVLEGGAQSAKANAAEFASRYGETTDLAKVLSDAGVHLRAMGDGTEMVVTPARHKVMALVLTVVTAVLVIAFTGFVKPVLSFQNIFVGAILSIFVFLFSLALATLWGVSTQVRVESTGLHLTKRWFGIPFRTQLARDEIESIESKFGMSAGYTTYYNLQLVTNLGRKITIAHNIRGQREVNWLAAELRRALRKP